MGEATRGSEGPENRDPENTDPENGERETKDRKVIVIAIDGPAASGKGTIARRIAARRGFAHLDTGLLYRIVAAKLLEYGGDPKDAEAATAVARSVEQVDQHRQDLRSREVGAASSVVAAHPGVREALFEYQRFFVSHPRGGAPGVVLDGRDIGTVVCPDADVKLFVTASAEERARRRTAELEGRGAPADFNAVLEDIRARDKRDSERAVAPLKQAEDALLLDTTHLGISEAIAEADSIISEALSR